jgi:hypothetical protein
MPLLCAWCGQPGPPFHTYPECPAVKARPPRPPKLAEPLVLGGGAGPAGRKPGSGKVWTRWPRD